MRILVVEDEEKLANAIKRALELQKYAVDVAYDGEEGFDLAVAENYDVVILDVMLPGKTGLEICAELRKEKKDTAVLMLTARGQISDKVSGLDIGADDYMVKPFSFEELFSRVRALIRRTSKEPSPFLHVRDLTVDPTNFSVKRSGEHISLSTKEFSILEYLMRNKNKVLSKEHIVQHVWNYDADILPSTVEVHIKNLRDKVDKPFATDIIQTVRGFGYKISDEA